MSESSLSEAAERLAEQLRHGGHKLVFAESCTAGLIAATLARIPGISEHLCGSAVVYRNATKTAWLGVSAEQLADEAIGPVSEAIAAAMVLGVLQRTPEADLAVSVTGHLGPVAPPGLEGVVYIGIARRESTDSAVRVESIFRHTLVHPSDASRDPLELRHDRQQRAAQLVLEAAAAAMLSCA